MLLIKQLFISYRVIMVAPRILKFVFVCGAALIGINVFFYFVIMKSLSPVNNYISVTELNTGLILLPDDFLSAGIDASELQDFTKINFSNKVLRKLAHLLAPAHLRVGGTMSERLIFSVEDVPSLNCEDCDKEINYKVCTHVKQLCKHKFLPFTILTGSKWIEINEFCKATNMRLLFSLNVLLRDENGWINENVKDLLAFTKLHNYSVDWQLGNEPNSFPHTFNVTLYPKILAEDFKKLRNILNEFGFKDSLLVGPDTTRPQPQRPECLKYMVEFLGNGSNYIDVRSWHQYYLNSRTAELDDFWAINTMLLLEKQMNAMKQNTKEYNNIPMWLTETSSSYGGGLKGISDSYGASALWIDKLGLASKNNITHVIRQSLIGGNYGLIDKDFNPLPDYWISVLFKKLVGNKVLNVSCISCLNSNCTQCLDQRLYAHCTKSSYLNQTGAFTIYGVNLKLEQPRMFFEDIYSSDGNLLVDEFVISATSNDRKSNKVNINGLSLNSEDELIPRKRNHIKFLKMPPYSIVFWVIKNSNLDICK